MSINAGVQKRRASGPVEPAVRVRRLPCRLAKPASQQVHRVYWQTAPLSPGLTVLRQNDVSARIVHLLLFATCAERTEKQAEDRLHVHTVKTKN